MREHSRTEKFRTGGECASHNRCLLAFVFLVILPIVAKPQAYSPSQDLPGDPYTISVSVDMVVLHATVRNRHGTLVSGLGKEDFQVYEDGILQQIEYFSHEDIPVTVGLVVDNSGSMRTEAP